MPSQTPWSLRAAPRRSRGSLHVAALAVLCLLAWAPHDGAAAESNSAPTVAASGIVEGRVFNATSGTYLNNARVMLEGSPLQAFTSESGEYRLLDVPVGAARLKVSYAGQDDLVEIVTVKATGITTADFTFNARSARPGAEAVVLDKFLVESRRYRNAQEIATNEERVAPNIKSVVALDSLGYVADGNVGEFVRFLPGVDVSNNGPNPDNASEVGVRGFGADSTMILVDGVPLASGSPSALTRTVQLDSVSINNASRLEVIKVATPDMSQDTPGGAINLVTRGAFEFPRADYSLSAALNGNTNTSGLLRRTPGPYQPTFKTLPSVRFSGTIPFSKTLGVSFSIASDNKYSLTRSSNMRDWFYTGRATTASGVSAPVVNSKGGVRIDNPVVDRFELNEYQWLEYRNSGNFRVDWRPFPGLELRANGQLSTMENTGLTRRTQWRYSNGIGIKNWGDTFVEGYQRTATFNPSHNASMTVDARDREGFTSQGYLTLKYRRHRWAIDASVNASESYNGAPDRANGHFSSFDGTIAPGRMDLTGVDKGVVGQVLLWDIAGRPIDYGSLANWNTVVTNGSRARSSESFNRDLVKQYKLDVSRELGFLPFPLILKAGGMQVEKGNHRWGAGASYEMRYIGPDVPNGEIQSPYASDAKIGYATPQYWIDPFKIYELYRKRPEYFDDQYVSAAQNIDSRVANYLSRVGTAKGLTETSSEWYGMATARLFHNRLTVITGARQSRKDREGYNVFNEPNYMYVKNADGTLYRDSVYRAGIRYDGAANAAGAARDVVLTDAALRARLQQAGVKYVPTRLELAPNGVANGTRDNNLHFARLSRYTRDVDASITQPWTPQVQAAFDLTDSLKLQAAWSKETRLPDLEGTGTSLLVSGASFQILENLTPTADPGGDGSITLANLKGQPELNESLNFKLAYYPQKGAGRYSISYYYKTVKNSWQTYQAFNTSSDYDELLDSMGLSRDEYQNYRIDTISPTGIKAIRKGFELEAVQNLGLLASWARGVDVFFTYTRRPVTATTGGEARLGWIPLLPVRAKWTGGLSYSMRRFSLQTRWTWTESGLTYSGSGNSVTMPDGSTRTVQLYNLNVVPPEINVQANYVLNRSCTLFAVFNRVASDRTYGRISDAETKLMPDYAHWRTMQNRGIAISVGATMNFERLPFLRF